MPGIAKILFAALSLSFSLPLAAIDFPPLVTQKCGVCHGVPRPGIMARGAWPKTLQSMIEHMQRRNVPINQLEMDQIVDFYRSHSPETLEVIRDDLQPTGLSFAKSAIGMPPSPDARPQVTSVKIVDFDGDGTAAELLVTDNEKSSVSVVRSIDGRWRESVISTGKAPVNTAAMDIDGDGDTDYGISLMGEMHPNDDLIGEFQILVNQGNGNFEKRVVLSGNIPRITDCAPADYDGDGDMDIVLAMFGWRYTGEIALLEQIAPMEFARKTLVKINGAMRVLPAHLDGDDRIDFVALVTQEHEMILRFLNRGNNQFAAQYITKATHPMWGSSSIHLCDLDQDGDEDILFTNGDMMDENPEPKPYHGLRWLENDNWEYRLHYLAPMPGCYDATPCDMDGDGDLDIVYSSLYFQWNQTDFPSLAWLENRGGFKDFVARKIAYSPSNLANIAVGDLNGDGKPDIVGGGMHVPGPLERAGRLTLWLQQ